MIEREETLGTFSAGDLNHFAICRDHNDLIKNKRSFIDPVITTDKNIVAEALRIESYFN